MDDLNPLAPGRGHCLLCEWELTTPLSEMQRLYEEGDMPRILR
jgi:hypothetical protein